MFGIMYYIATEPEAAADGKHFVHSRCMVFDGHRESENLEHGAQLIHVLRHPVATRIGMRDIYSRFAKRVRQRDHSEDLAGIDVHDDTAGGPRTESFASL